jgi:hypothetical protein
LGMRLVAEVYSTAGNNIFGDRNQLIDTSQNASVVDLFKVSALRPENITTVYDASGKLIDSTGISGASGRALLAVVGGIIGAIVGFGIPGAVVGAAAGSALGPEAAKGVVSLIVPLVLVIALFIQFFRLLFSLLNCYLQILIMTIAGPLLIMFSSLPGRGGGLTLWWKTLLANSLVFPTVFAVILLAGLILGSTDQATWQGANLPLFGGLNFSILRVLIAYGLILGTPAIPGMVRDAFGIRLPGAFIQSAMGGANAGYGVFAGAAGGAFGASYLGGLMRARRNYRENLPLARFGDPRALDAVTSTEARLANRQRYAEQRSWLGGVWRGIEAAAVQGGRPSGLPRPRHN